MVELGTPWTIKPGDRLSIVEQPKWSLLGTTSSKQRQMRWKRQRPCLQRVSKHVPLLHLYPKITCASPGNEVLDQCGPLVRKAAPHTHAIGNKVCFSVMKGGVIPNPKFCLL